MATRIFAILPSPPGCSNASALIDKSSLFMLLKTVLGEGSQARPPWRIKAGDHLQLSCEVQPARQRGGSHHSYVGRDKVGTASGDRPNDCTRFKAMSNIRREQYLDAEQGDLTRYAGMIGEGFASKIDRLPQIIGTSHELSVGEYKESILHCPSSEILRHRAA